jgi:hypothetical protein
MKFSRKIALGILAGLALAGASIPPAQSQMATARLDELLPNFISSGQRRCTAAQSDPAVQNLRAQGKILEAYEAESSIHTVCVCMPTQARAMLKKLPAAQREARVTQEEFAQKYLPRIMNTCAGEAIKASYGEGCAERVGGYRRTPLEYCGCMKSRLDELTESELSQIAKDNAAYVPAATEARKKGLPLPKRPAALDQMKAFDEACSK